MIDVRENTYEIIVRSLSKIKGHSSVLKDKIRDKLFDELKPIPFEDVSFYFKNARNIGFAADAFIQYVELDGYPMAMKIIKMSKEESLPQNYENTSNINNLNKNAILKPRSTGYNVWREISAMETLSPHKSGLPNFPYFYGYFITKWPGELNEDMYWYDRDKDSKYREYIKSRETTGICAVLFMELFDYDLPAWTEKQHSFSDWKDVYCQILDCFDGLKQFNIIHNDTHKKNFLVKRDAGRWLIILTDFGSNLSMSYDLSSSEKMLYKTLMNSNRDLKLILHTFNRNDIAVHHFAKLKRTQTYESIKKEHPDLLPKIVSYVKKPIEHTLCWIALSEVMAQNLQIFEKYIDVQKLLPSSIDEILIRENHKLSSKKVYDINLLRSKIVSLKE